MVFQLLTRANVSHVVATLILTAILFCPCDSIAQDSGNDSIVEIDQHLQFGEISSALRIADGLPAEVADQQYAKISSVQQKSGANNLETLNKISLDKVRYQALFQQGFGNPVGVPNGNLNGFGQNNANPNGPNGFGGAANNGLAGGITEADFQPLINLIKSTIDPDSWDDSNGDGTIQAYPAGVYVDSTGTLQKLKIDSNRSLRRLAKTSAADSGNRMVNRNSVLRKISLNRLEKQAQILAAQGKPIDDAIVNLAGMYAIEYLMFIPESNDVVIAGPAGEWKLDVDGHAVNVSTGKPVLSLDDLIVCLRNAQRSPGGNFGKFGCSIVPRKQNLVETQEFISTSPLKGKAWRKKLQETLGYQDVGVFGVDPATHAGMVLVEADYRMKLVAMGLEPTIPEIPSYLSRLDVGPNGAAEPMDVVRWWFTMNYDEILTDEDRSVFQFNGTGVKVLSENEFIDRQGERIHTGQSDGPTAGFAKDFTNHFDKIADEYPVYRRLKNLFDLSIVSTLIRTHRLDEKADWNLTYFGNHPDYSNHIYNVPTAATPTQVFSVMNHRVISRRVGNTTTKHFLVAVSGGITFDAIKVVRSKSKLADGGELDQLHLQSSSDDDSDHWWWD